MAQRYKSGGALQSIYFPATEWYKGDAIDWVIEHGYKPIKVTHEGGNYRFRLIHPYTFRHFITKRGLRDGKLVYFVIGFR